MIYLITDINPEPWAVGPLDIIYRGHGAGRKHFPVVGPNTKLKFYQDAIRSEMETLYPEAEMLTGLVEVEFHFWRSSAHGQPADATNLQKATEDALQGILFENDRDNRWATGHVVEQTPDTRPALVIHVAPYDPPDMTAELAMIETRPLPGTVHTDTGWIPPTEDYF